MAKTYNLYLDQGTTFSANITARDDSRNIRDLTGYTAQSSMRRSYFSANSVSFSASIPNPSSGNVVISLNDSQTANLKYGRYVYDIIIINTSNVVERLIEGIVVVNPEATK